MEAARAGGLSMRKQRGPEAVACPLVPEPRVVPAGKTTVPGHEAQEDQRPRSMSVPTRQAQNLTTLGLGQSTQRLAGMVPSEQRPDNAKGGPSRSRKMTPERKSALSRGTGSGGSRCPPSPPAVFSQSPGPPGSPACAHQQEPWCPGPIVVLASDELGFKSRLHASCVASGKALHFSGPLRRVPASLSPSSPRREHG